MNEDAVKEKSPQNRFEEKFGTRSYRYPQRVRRCFMTGKQCIFCSPQSRADTLEVQAEAQGPSQDKPFSVFVVMPFRPTLDTFYEWSLKGYLRDGLAIKDADTQIRRADEFRDIGYVMCEKICRRIQEADLVVVDLSIENPNAMYEMGIAIGLNKPLLILCNELNVGRLTDDYLKSIGLKREQEQFRVIKYPSVGYLVPGDNDPVEAAGRVSLKPRMAKMQIVPLLVADRNAVNTREWDDIPATFSEALRGAVGVAAGEIAQSKAKFASLREAIAILTPPGVRHLGNLTPKHEVYVVGMDGNPRPFTDIVEKVNEAFTCIIDLAGENPHSYFWLGYCHGRGINAIPISRDVSTVVSRGGEQGPKKVLDSGRRDRSSTPEEDEETEHVIAFDIRALWYIRFRARKIKELSVSLRAALEELIAKDVPRQQRNIFWERLTRHPRIHIYTGAVHHKELNREVVGDWDQRTVSELVRYLSSAEESVVPELERPIYSPGTIKSKLGPDWDKDTSLLSYIDLVKSELKDKNCIIVASADVNPLTEVVLAHAYDVANACFKDPQVHEVSASKKREVVVALKGWKADEDEKRDDTTVIPTFFSRPGRREKLDAGKRGFLVNDNAKPLQKLYKSQDQVTYSGKGFTLLSHLVVIQNPFWENNQDAIIVLLNGVSGPGTFGLAEVLTGGRSTGKAIASEKLLEQFNLRWAQCDADTSVDRVDASINRFGIEGIVEVKIQPKGKSQASDAEDSAEFSEETSSDVAIADPVVSKQTVQDKFYDLREVVRWGFYEDIELMEKNPRSFQMPSRNRGKAPGGEMRLH